MSVARITLLYLLYISAGPHWCIAHFCNDRCRMTCRIMRYFHFYRKYLSKRNTFLTSYIPKVKTLYSVLHSQFPAKPAHQYQLIVQCLQIQLRPTDDTRMEQSTRKRDVFERRTAIQNSNITASVKHTPVFSHTSHSHVFTK